MMDPENVDAQEQLVVPPPGDDRRAWMRHQLQRRVNPGTNRRWNQADVAREAQVNESTVSLVYTGRRQSGPGSEKVMRITARILGTTTDALFGVALPAGEGYPGSPNLPVPEAGPEATAGAAPEASSVEPAAPTSEAGPEDDTGPQS